MVQGCLGACLSGCDACRSVVRAVAPFLGLRRGNYLVVLCYLCLLGGVGCGGL